MTEPKRDFEEGRPTPEGAFLRRDDLKGWQYHLEGPKVNIELWPGVAGRASSWGLSRICPSALPTRSRGGEPPSVHTGGTASSLWPTGVPSVLESWRSFYVGPGDPTSLFPKLLFPNSTWASRGLAPFKATNGTTKLASHTRRAGAGRFLGAA